MNKSIDVRVIEKAFDLLSELTWLKGSYAQNDRGVAVMPSEPSACSFCLYGALEAAMLKTGTTKLDAIHAVRRVVLLKGHPSISKFNDEKSTNLEVVFSVLQQAKADLEKRV